MIKSSGPVVSPPTTAPLEFAIMQAPTEVVPLFAVPLPIYSTLNKLFKNSSSSSSTKGWVKQPLFVTTALLPTVGSSAIVPISTSTFKESSISFLKSFSSGDIKAPLSFVNIKLPKAVFFDFIISTFKSKLFSFRKFFILSNSSSSTILVVIAHIYLLLIKNQLMNCLQY